MNFFIVEIFECFGTNPSEAPICAEVLFTATGIRTLVDEFPGSLNLAFEDGRPTFDLNQFREGIDAPARLANLFDLPVPVPIIGMEHHDCHAWFSYLASPFARDPKPVMIAVVDGSGDFASLSLYIGENGSLRRIRDNASIFDSLGMFYSVISSGGHLLAARAATWVPRLTEKWTEMPIASTRSCGKF